MVVWSSNLFIPETPYDGSVTSSDLSIKPTSKRRHTDYLKCYVCDEFYDKPRILPCGHSYCASCLTCLRENAVREFNKTRDRNAHRRGDCGYFSCPYPNCHYSMKIMKVTRWASKNKALSKAAAAAKRQEKEKQSVETQTNLDGTSVLVSVPRGLFMASRDSGLIPKLPRTPSPTRTSVMLQHLLQHTISTENLDVKYCKPPDNQTTGWKSYAFMFGMAMLDQCIKMT